MTDWYDPIDGRWYKMPEPKPVEVEAEHAVEDVYTFAESALRVNNVWEAVVATATATQMAAGSDDQQEGSRGVPIPPDGQP